MSPNTAAAEPKRRRAKPTFGGAVAPPTGLASRGLVPRGRRDRSRRGRRRPAGGSSPPWRAGKAPAPAVRSGPRSIPRDRSCAMSDLRPGRGDEVAEDPRCDVLLSLRERAHGRVEMRANDPLGAAELLERRQPQTREPAARSSSQSRVSTSWRTGLDPRLAAPCRADPAPALRRADLAGLDLRPAPRRREPARSRPLRRAPP